MSLSAADRAKLAGVRPELRSAAESIQEAAQAAIGKPVVVSSGLRTFAQQQALYDATASNPNPVAVPGSSRHEVGAAVDFAIVGGTDADYRTLSDIIVRTGLVSGYNFARRDPGHAQLNESWADSVAAWDAMQQEDSATSSAWWLLGGGLLLALAGGR